MVFFSLGLTPCDFQLTHVLIIPGWERGLKRRWELQRQRESKNRWLTIQSFLLIDSRSLLIRFFFCLCGTRTGRQILACFQRLVGEEPEQMGTLFKAFCVSAFPDANAMPPVGFRG